MEKATKALHQRIAIIFDFDETLAPDSYTALLESVGLDTETFNRERLNPLLEDGWDDILAKFYCLIQASKEGHRITAEHLAEVGRNIQLFDGVPEMFDRLRACVREANPGVELEFYLLSSGILEIAQATPIADQFTALWGCEFHFDADGQIAFIKQIITHPEKNRYLLQLAKGLNKANHKAKPSDIYRNVPDEEMYVPLSQVIYLGDGTSDMPVFRLLNEEGGTALGIYEGDRAEEWGGYSEMHEGRRVYNLVPADYREDSELMQSLRLSIEAICKRIQLLELSKGE